MIILEEDKIMANSLSTNEIDEKLMSEIKRKAKENLRGIIYEEQLGYEGYLVEEMKKLFKEIGIDWKLDKNNVSID